MAHPKKIIFIFNPLSGDGAAGRKWPEIESALGKLKIEYELAKTEGDLVEKTMDLLESGIDSDTVLAGVGGDGTHCAVINGLMKFRQFHPDKHIPPYSFIPLGTANNMAKSFNIGIVGKSGYYALRRTLLGCIYGADFNIDVARLGDIFFMDAFTAGVDAHILAGRNRDRTCFSRNTLLRSILKGYSIYLLNVFKSLSKCVPLDCDVDVDGVRTYSGSLFNIVINNTRIYAGEFDLTDSAIANDGLLDMLIFTGRRDYFRRYLLGNRIMPRPIISMAHRNTDVIQHRKGRSFNIRFREPIKAQVDGEIVEMREEYQIETLPSALTIKIPVEPE